MHGLNASAARSVQHGPPAELTGGHGAVRTAPRTASRQTCQSPPRSAALAACRRRRDLENAAAPPMTPAVRLSFPLPSKSHPPPAFLVRRSANQTRTDFVNGLLWRGDRSPEDGGMLVMAILFGMYPFLLKLYADGDVGRKSGLPGRFHNGSLELARAASAGLRRQSSENPGELGREPSDWRPTARAPCGPRT